MAITIRGPFAALCRLISNAYRTLTTHMRMHGYTAGRKNVIECFEHDCVRDGMEYMNI